jgi:hypothetical protein
VCWALGISRRTDHPDYEYQGGWINTDAMVRDIKKTGGLFTRCEPKVGCVVVFPGPPARPIGHCGIVTQVAPLRVAHCSSSNARGGRSAILVTDGNVFQVRDAVYGWFKGLREPHEQIALEIIARMWHTRASNPLLSAESLDGWSATYTTEARSLIAGDPAMRARLDMYRRVSL